MKEKSKKWIKIITYLLPFIWVLIKGFNPTFMVFETINLQGYFFLFLLFGLCTSLLTFPKFEMFVNIFSGSPNDKKFIHSSKIMFVCFMIVDILWMVYSVTQFNVFTWWKNNTLQILFLFTLTYYLWFSFAMNVIRYIDIIKFSEQSYLEEE